MSQVRQTKNLSLEQTRFLSFCAKVITPVLAELQLEGTKYTSKISVSARQINDEYGHSAAKVFTILFKRIVPGGKNFEGVGFRSCWVPNRTAMAHLVDWLSITEEMTSRSLYLYLVANKCEELRWVKELKVWLPVEMIDRINEYKDISKDDGIDYTKLLSSLKSPHILNGDTDERT